jgi:hypothetical protein
MDRLYHFHRVGFKDMVYANVMYAKMPCSTRVNATIDHFWISESILGSCGIRVSFGGNDDDDGFPSYCNEISIRGDYCTTLQTAYLGHFLYNHREPSQIEGCVTLREPDVFWSMYTLPPENKNVLRPETMQDYEDYENGRIWPRSTPLRFRVVWSMLLFVVWGGTVIFPFIFIGMTVDDYYTR